MRGEASIMKKFLWFISIGVCAAGLVYHFSGYRNAPQDGAAAADKTFLEMIGPGSENIVFRESHLANSRLLSASVWGHCTFWYFTPADQAVSDYVLYGVLPAPGAVYDPDLEPLRAEWMNVSRSGAALKAQGRHNGTTKPGSVQDAPSVGKKN